MGGGRAGASSGIGAETARVLAMRGAHVVMAVRNVDAAGAVREAVLAEAPAAKLDLMELDLSSMDSVRKFASDFTAKGLPLNILMYVLYLQTIKSPFLVALHFGVLHRSTNKCNRVSQYANTTYSEYTIVLNA